MLIHYRINVQINQVDRIQQHKFIKFIRIQQHKFDIRKAWHNVLFLIDQAAFYAKENAGDIKKKSIPH